MPPLSGRRISAAGHNAKWAMVLWPVALNLLAQRVTATRCY
jgi:hypothetical protein